MSIVVVSYSQYILFIELGMDLDYSVAVFLRCVVLAFMLIPISYAGIGFREVGTLAVLSAYGLEFNLIMAFTSILLFFQLMISMIGLALVGLERVRGDSL
jgi:uncharacterized membrane protein YbhN (UPF0104 family)